MTTTHIRMALLDERIDNVIHTRPADATVILYDSPEGPTTFGRASGRRIGVNAVAGLRLRIGRRKATWYFFADKQDHRRKTEDNPRGRVVTSKSLGAFDHGVTDGKARQRADWHVSTDAARAKASILRGQVAGGNAPESRRDAITFREALEGKLDADGNKIASGYLDKLQAKADDNGKAAKWRANVKAISDKHILPRWGNFTLAEMSEMRKAVGDWYNTLAAATPSTAHHIRSIIATVYRWAKKNGATLPVDNPASREIDRKPAYKTKPGRKALPRLRTKPVNQFPQWLADWRKLPTEMQRAYWLFLIFTGQRPGEVLRIEWEHVDYKHNTITIPDAKADNDITFPMSEQIRRVLDLAKEAATDKKSKLIFEGPNCAHWSHREPPLDVPGHGMRRTFKSVAGTLGIPNEMSGRLLGHQPEGVSADYEDVLEVQRAAFLTDMQAKVSAAIVGLLGCDPTREKFKPLPPTAREVAQAKGAETYKSTQACPHDHIGLRYVSTNRCVACVAEKNHRQKANRDDWRKRRRAA